MPLVRKCLLSYFLDAIANENMESLGVVIDVAQHRLTVGPENFSCRICFPAKMNGATKPRGSNTELNVDKIPLLDRGLSYKMILNWSVLDSMH